MPPKAKPKNTTSSKAKKGQTTGNSNAKIESPKNARGTLAREVKQTAESSGTDIFIVKMFSNVLEPPKQKKPATSKATKKKVRPINQKGMFLHSFSEKDF